MFKLERFSGVAVDICGVLGMRQCVGRVVGGCWCEVDVGLDWLFKVSYVWVLSEP
jgi:hypothetical protein